MSDDVTLIYLKTLVIGKVKTAIVQFTYSGVMYKDALMKLGQKLGQPQLVDRAYLDKFKNKPLNKIYNSDSITSFASML